MVQHSGVINTKCSPNINQGRKEFFIDSSGYYRQHSVLFNTFNIFFYSLVFIPISVPGNRVSSLDTCDFSFGFSISSSDSMRARSHCRQLCKALNVVVVLEVLPSSTEFNCLSKIPSTSCFSLVISRASLSFCLRRVR